MTPRDNAVAHLTATLGAGIILTELVRHWVWAHPMEGSVIGVGALFGFVGAYRLDRRGALEAGSFVIDSTARLIAVIRTGRGSSAKITIESTSEHEGRDPK